MSVRRIGSKSGWCAVTVLALVMVVGRIIAAEVKFALPPETNKFKPGPGAEIAVAQCFICHSADYISTQPPMPRAFWKADVQKMQKVYGSPIPDAQVERLVDYLVKNYGDEKSRGNPPSPTTTTASGGITATIALPPTNILGTHTRTVLAPYHPRQTPHLNFRCARYIADAKDLSTHLNLRRRSVFK